MESIRVLFWILIFLLISSSAVIADGGYVWVETFVGQAKSGGQEAIILYFDNRETLVLRTDYEGELADFSWIIPVPSSITANDVYEPDSIVFSWMDELTAPTFYIHTMKPYDGCIFFGAGASGESVSTDRENVEVLETIMTDTYEINVLSVSQPQDLLDWFDRNDYAYPTGAEEIFSHYILMGWYFLAVKMSPSEAGAVVEKSLAPLQIAFEANEPVFPLMISSFSSRQETEILIHFLSDHRYRTKNVTSKEVDYQHTGDPYDYKNNYHQWMKRQVEDSNGELYFVEYASWGSKDNCLAINNYLVSDPIDCDEDVFATRFRSYFSPDLFNDDIYFEQDRNDNFFKVIVNIYKSQTSSFRFLASLFFLATAFLIRRKRSF